MYSVDERDDVEELRDVPQSSIGAPLPAIVATEDSLSIAYVVQTTDLGRNDTTVRIVHHNAGGELVALVEFVRAEAHLFGPPNDEAFAGHPLAARGLHPYGVFEVRHSSWLRKLEPMNAVHPHHKPAKYERLRHFVFAFHDSTFECIAEGFSFEVREGSISSVVRDLAKRLGQSTQ